MRSYMTPSIVLSLVLALAAEGSAVSQSARLDLPAVVEKVQKKYDGAADFRAAFNQTLTNATFKRRTSSTGEVLLKKPGRMRWNYKTPETKTYVSDGEVLWLFEPEDKQAFKQDLKGSQLPAALAFLTGKGKLSEEFDITIAKDPPVGTSRDYVLALSPKQPQAQVKSLLFVVDPDTFFVRETFIVDAQGNSNDILFSDVKINVHLPESTFHFTPPAGVRIVDTNKMR
jgi:outer membrane lipoprotein carrier protein